MEGVLERTAAPPAILGVRAWLPPCGSPGGRKQLSRGLGRTGRRGSLPGGALAPSAPHSGLALISHLGTAPHLPWCLSLHPADAHSSSFLACLVSPVLFYSLLFLLFFYDLIEAQLTHTKLHTEVLIDTNAHETITTI